MKKPDRFEKAEVAWAALKTAYAPGLIAKVRHAIPADLPASGRDYLLDALEAPSRETGSTTKSSGSKCVSIKMGVAFGVDSGTLEQPTAMRLERSVGVIAYLNQAPMIRLSFRSNGRSHSHHHRPDFVVVEQGRIFLLEDKRVAAIEEKNSKHPGFYVQRADGRWTCPAGEAAAGKMGMEYVIWTDLDFDPLTLRNLRYLNNFTTPERLPEIKAPDEIQAYLESRGRATVAAVLQDLVESICIDDILSAIARDEITFDLASAPLATSREHCWLYRDAATMAAFSAIAEPQEGVSVEIAAAPTVSIRAGDDLMWQGRRWNCIAVTSARVTLVCGSTPATMELPTFMRLIELGELSLVGGDANDSGYEEAAKQIIEAKPGDLATAYARLQTIKPVLDGLTLDPNRTERRHLASFRSAERTYGPGFGLIGLIPKTKNSGNTTPRLPETVLEIVKQHIEEHYLNATNRNRTALYKLICGTCEGKNFTPPSYSWLCNKLADLPKFETELARKGHKGAYRWEPRIGIEGQTSADYAFQVAHVDHTVLDLAVLFGLHGLEATKVWVTCMIDVFSRRVLAFSLSFEDPSDRLVTLVVRECVRRHGRLPEKIICDGGSEFGSTWFETTCAIYRVIVQRRPASKPRGGAEGERFFGTMTTQFANFLTGNTQLTKNVRALTKEVDPFKRAVWTVDVLRKELARYIYEAYDQSTHTSLLCSPREAFESSMESAGERRNRLIRFDELFLILTSATTDKKKAIIQPDGVKINYIYFNAPELRAHLRQSVPVRYDPFDLANAWAFVGERWIKVVSRHASLLTRFSERDIGVVTTTWKARRTLAGRQSISEPQMIRLLQELLGKESSLLARRVALEEKRLRAQDPNSNPKLLDVENAPLDNSSESLDDVLKPEVSPRTSNAQRTLTVNQYKPMELLS